ncbi:MAG TPA: imidazole glycerol phosphate synthase subunit HisH [Bacteroidota bacterium]|nr:imidazole glycerol phosphate synthase subunit HisH [Bacteroidota bacterium]
MITIVDYGMGNLRNVHRACTEIGVESVVTSDPIVVRDARWLILPGVGAFGEAVRRIESMGLRAPILEHAAKGFPLLGICLGMQLLLEASEESPGAEGLGLLKGSVRRISGNVKIPHIGWNDVLPMCASPLFPDRNEQPVAYFDHSYYVPEMPETVAVTDYGVRCSAAVKKEYLFGVQFHPEKSHVAGLNLLRRFAEIHGRGGNA